MFEVDREYESLDAASPTPDDDASTQGWDETREEGEPVNEAASNAQ